MSDLGASGSCASYVKCRRASWALKADIAASGSTSMLVIVACFNTPVEYNIGVKKAGVICAGL
jgi:hypothetical protein